MTPALVIFLALGLVNARPLDEALVRDLFDGLPSRYIFNCTFFSQRLHMHNMNYYVSLSSKCDGSTSGKFKFSFKHTPYKDAQKGKSMCDTFIHHLAVQQYSLWRSIFWKRVCLSTWLMDINIHVLQLQNGIQNTGRTKTRNMRYTNCTGADNILKYTG